VIGTVGYRRVHGPASERTDAVGSQTKHQKISLIFIFEIHPFWGGVGMTEAFHKYEYSLASPTLHSLCVYYAGNVA
jgi:hypothetical protein